MTDTEPRTADALGSKGSGGINHTQERVNVLGVGINPLTISSAATTLLAGGAAAGFRGYVTVTGVHGVMEARRDPNLRKIHNRSFLTTPDGMPMVWCAHWNGYPRTERVYGPDLMLEMFRLTAESGHRHFFFGGADGVVDTLADNLRDRYSGAQIVGAVTPPFRPLDDNEERELAEQLDVERPHYLWVGLSTPKQEHFMHGFLEKNPRFATNWNHGFVMLGVGAAFDIHAGVVRQAPRWMQRAGLEWAFRLCVEPRRLWKRYARNNSGFILGVVTQMMGLKHYPIEK